MPHQSTGRRSRTTLQRILLAAPKEDPTGPCLLLRGTPEGRPCRRAGADATERHCGRQRSARAEDVSSKMLEDAPLHKPSRCSHYDQAPARRPANSGLFAKSREISESISPPWRRCRRVDVSYFAQIPDGQRRRLTTIETPSQSVRSLIQAEPGTHPGVRGLAPKHVGRKDIPCKYLQSFKENC